MASGLAGLLTARGADDPTFDYNRFNVGTRFFFNISAEIQNGAVPALTGPVYDDGSVQTDISGNAGGQTWNWSFEDNNQLVGYNPALLNGGNLELHATTSPRDGWTDEVSDDPEWGFDLTYGRVLGTFKVGRRKGGWGVEGGFGSTDLELRGNDGRAGTVNRQAYQFTLNPGVLYPQAPYAGTFAGPGPLVGAAPAPLAPPVPLAATSSQYTQIDGLFYGLHVGPFVEIPLFSRLALTLAGGGAVTHAEADVTVQESFSLPGGTVGTAPRMRTSSGSDDDWLVGAYGEVRLAVDLGNTVSAYLGGQYQILDDFQVLAGSKRVTIKLSESFAALAGLSFRF